MKKNRRSLSITRRSFNFKTFFAVACPFPRGSLVCLSANHFNFIRYHKSRIKSHPELPYQVGIFFRVFGKFFKEHPCPRARDGSKRLNQVRLVHADSVVWNRQGFRVLVKGNINARIEADGLIRLVSDGQVFELVKRVRRVGDKLPQKNLPVWIKGVDNKVQKTADFCLKLMLCHGALLEEVVSG